MQDKKFFQLALALENANQAELDRLTLDIKQIFKRYTRGGQINDVQKLTQQVNKTIDKYYDRFVVHLKTSSERVGSLKAQQAIYVVMPLLRKAGLFREALDLYKSVANYGTDVGKRLMFNGWAGRPLGKTITTIRSGTQKTVQNIIANGVAEGKSARAIAKDLEQYVNPLPGSPKIKPYQVYRQRFGRAKNYKVPGVQAGSVQYNTMRIARTETAHIYRQATVDFYDNREWNKGYTWNLSNRHPEKDICDEYASKTYKKSSDLPEAHPHCLCDVRPIIMSQAELRQLLGKEPDITESAFERAIRASKELVSV